MIWVTAPARRDSYVEHGETDEVRIRNEVEEEVRAEVARRREEILPGENSCWCALCEADVTALAMTILPPRYSTSQQNAEARRGESSNAVRSAVFTAMKRVTRRPKHRRSTPENYPLRVRLINFTYEEGAALVTSLTRRSDLPCTCPLCLSDTLTYALNRYPPKYGVMHGGRENLPAYQRDYMREELQVVISHAAGKIASHPRHSLAAGS